jgi:hypothetical protein
MKIEIDELMRNPTKFGAPSFEQFCKNREKWFGKETDVLDRLVNSSDGSTARNSARRLKHEILGYRTTKLEEVERIALENGINLRSLEYCAAFQPLGGGEADILVKWMTKDEYLKKTQ